MPNPKTAIVSLFVAYTVYLAWAVSGIALLGDDWGHVALASGSLLDLWRTSYVGEIGLGGYYRPVTETSLYLDVLIFGADTSVLHLVNLLLHLLTSFLVYRLGLRLFDGETRVSVGAALFFFVAPIHASNVYWVVGRGDILCALFYCLSLVLAPGGGARAPFVQHAVRTFVFLVCFLSKEMGMTLPGGLLVLFWAEGRLRDRHAWVSFGLCILALALCLFLRASVLGSVFGGVSTPDLRAMFLDVFRSGGLMGLSDVKVAGPVLVLATGVVLWARKISIGPLILPVILCGVVLIPGLGRLHRWYLYLPSMFFFLGVSFVWLANRGGTSRTYALVFSGVVVYYAGIFGAGALEWRYAGRVSEAYLSKTADAVEETSGRVLLLNVPSAYDGIPIFAHNLMPALRSRGVDSERIALANHLWMLSPDARVVINVTPEGIHLDAVSGYFSFHRGEALRRDSEGRLEPQSLDYGWGRVSVETEREVHVHADSSYVVLAYDGVSYRESGLELP